MRLVTYRSLSLQVRLHPIQEKVFSKDWGKKTAVHASAVCSPITCIAGNGNLRRREKFRRCMCAREEKGAGGPLPFVFPRALYKKTSKYPFLLVKMQVYSAYLIVLHKFSTFNMNALSLPSNRGKGYIFY